jgi:lysophospholipase L1-like esterase
MTRSEQTFLAWRQWNTRLYSLSIDYAAQQDLVYIDYYAALVGPDGELRSELGNDGVHPNRDGYAIMRRLLEEALARSN